MLPAQHTIAQGENQAKRGSKQCSPELQLSELGVNRSRSCFSHLALHTSGEGGEKASERGREEGVRAEKPSERVD